MFARARSVVFRHYAKSRVIASADAAETDVISASESGFPDVKRAEVCPSVRVRRERLRNLINFAKYRACTLDVWETIVASGGRDERDEIHST
jgi:hypothetical protein